MKRFASLLVPVAVLSLVALPVQADWLVTRDGARMETKGPWKVKGKLVVFETADGKLSSLRVADVDLDASRRVTEEAVAARAQAEAEPEKAPARKKSVRVITDKDVAQAPPPQAAPEGEEPAAATGPASGPGVLVEAWAQERDPEKDHVQIKGTLANASSLTAAELKLKVLIYDETGSLMATSQAAVAKAALTPGQKTEFKADFPGFYSFATIKFEPESRRLETRPADEPVPEAPPE